MPTCAPHHSAPVAQKLLAALLALPLLVAACGGDSRAPAPTATPADSGSIKDPAPAVTAAQAASPTPGSATPSTAVSSEPFTFQSTEDGVTMKGHLYSVQGPKRKVVILAHGANEDQKAWQAFAQELALRGVAAVTFDFRGYGETGGTKDQSKLAADLEVAVRYLKSLDWPLVYVVSSEIGGTATLKVAASQELAGVATISSLPSVTGIDARSDVARVVEPKLFLAGAGDTAAGTAVITLAAAASEPRMSRIIEGTSATGIALLKVEAAKQALLAFINP